MAQKKIISPAGADTAIYEVGMLATPDGIPAGNIANPLVVYVSESAGGGTSFVDQKIVSAASTATQLTSHAVVGGVLLQALSTSTAKIYWGFANTVTATTGFELQPGQPTSISSSTTFNNTNQIYFWSTDATQGVCVSGS